MSCLLPFEETGCAKLPYHFYVTVHQQLVIMVSGGVEDY
jgi:hypothetical protein